eukprot:gb/GECG01003611.1/.p1 GENE.gb/GECG01003611.1/~~gb/GECG01003611.1/.p1  ORF type:complete len:242 (+),score=26.12 gb/GECG01003611.1/:1-726(+)
MSSWVVCMGILGLLVVLGVHAETLDYSRVHLVDKSEDNRNWLFRGNFPGGPNGTYAYDELIQFLHKRALDEGGAPLPKNFDLRVVSFDNIFESNFNLEKRFYQNHPSKANLTIWTLIGGLLPPQFVDNKTREQILEDPDLLFAIDKLPSRLEQAHQWVHGMQDSPLVVYWHCEGGCDRTGEISGAYYVTYQGYNITAAYDKNTKDCGRPENYWSINMLGWYCLYYEKQSGNDIGDCLNIKG